ncbi:MAG: hypothetical protein ACQKBY_06730 [Verrucomicrobiales bacterium]
MSRRRLDLPSSRPRSNRRAGRPTLRQAFQNAERIARERSTRRELRRQGMSRQAAIADALDYEEEDHRAGLLSHLLRFLGFLLLLPLCFVTTITLFQRVADRHFLDAFWRTSEFIYFTVGFGLMLGWFLLKPLRRPFLYLYVLGHELTHALFVYLCAGRVASINVSSSGGYILTNKSNILIALSPYCVPFWSLVLMLAYAGYSFFFQIPNGDSFLLLGLGFTWGFHFLWTAWMIPRDQPDLRENGTILSLAVIYLANVVLLAVMIIIASPTLTAPLFCYNWANNLFDLLETLPAFFQR